MVSAGAAVSAPGGGVTAVRVVLTTRETLPVESVAVSVMLFSPAVKGMLAMVQFVPLIEAVPEGPVLEAHVTVAPPLPPVTVPESETVAEVVVAAGTVTVKTRGGGVTACRVTVTLLEELPVVSVAVTVMLLSPTASGMLDAAQFAPFTAAVPDPPALVLHVTVGVPLPPATVPDSDTVADVVVPGVASIARARGAVCPRAAYRDRMPDLSSSDRPVLGL